MKIVSKNIKQTREIAKDLAGKILKQKQKSNFATVVGLSGELGSGKTTFVQAFAKALGVKSKVLSPTFVLMKRHGNLFHIDAYRIKNPKEIIDLGWKEIINNPQNIILVEWAENIKKIFPKGHIWINLAHKEMSDSIKDRQKRTIDICFVK